MENLYVQTALVDMLNLSTDKQKFAVKMECDQPAGSFKLRGMDYLCKQAVKDGASQLISSSGGNAGLSAAYAGRKLGVPVTVVVPESTPQEVLDLLRLQGATALVKGKVWDEADAYAKDLVEKTHGAYVPPFDNELLWEGHATMIDELKDQCASQPDAIICSVGGGGLLCGIMRGLLRNGWQDTTIIGVETTGAGSFHAAVNAGKPVVFPIQTIATSLGAEKVSQQAVDYYQQYSIISQLVSDEAAKKACVRFADEYRKLVEPACGASLSLVYDQADVLKDFQNIVVIACGGAKVSLSQLQQWQAE